MTEHDTGMPRAGWYPDSAEPGAHRWWDGAAWTADVRRPEREIPLSTPEAPLTRRQLREQAGSLTTGSADGAAEVAAQAASSPLVPARTSSQPEVGQASIAVLDRPAEVSNVELARGISDYVPMASPDIQNRQYEAATTSAWRGSPHSFSAWLFALSPLWYGGTNALIYFAVPSVRNVGLPFLGPLLLIVLTIGLAVNDRRHLREAGYVPPSLWWVLLPLGYFIVRTVRTGSRGAGVLVVYLITQLILGVVVGLTVIAVVAATVNQGALAPTPAQIADPSAPLTADQRAYLLTADGAEKGLSAAIGATGKTVTSVTCNEFPSTIAGATTSCVMEVDGVTVDLVLRATPDEQAPWVLASAVPRAGTAVSPS